MSMEGRNILMNIYSHFEPFDENGWEEHIDENTHLEQLDEYIWPGSLARSCNVATDRLVYQDVRGLSTTEPCPRSDLGLH